MTPETRILLASCAGSFLLLLVFLLLAVMTVALYMLWRGLRVARSQLPIYMSQVVSYAQRAEQSTHSTAESVVGPQIRVAGAWAGIKAGARALFEAPAPDGTSDAGDQTLL